MWSNHSCSIGFAGLADMIYFELLLFRALIGWFTVIDVGLRVFTVALLCFGFLATAFLTLSTPLFITFTFFSLRNNFTFCPRLCLRFIRIKTLHVPRIIPHWRTIRIITVLLQCVWVLHAALINPSLMPVLLRLHHYLHHLELILLDLSHHLQLLHISAVHLTSLTTMMVAAMTFATLLLNHYCLRCCCQLALWSLMDSCFFSTLAKGVRIN